jgi:hypothetical protein
MTMSYEQIVGGDFITYDPGTGFENQAEGSLTAIVAYQRDGEFLSSDEDGPLRLFVISDKNDNVVDGHWTVKWVSQIRLKPMSEEWSLYLEGALTEQMDRNSFESCSAPGCHQASWTDEDGNNWSGVPIYYLAGRVDDAIIHEGRAYNDDFAQAGYSIEIFAGDGTNVSIESSLTDFNRHILVASTVKGDPLDDEYFPLRLVGEGLEKNEMIGALAQIILRPNEGVELPSGEVISEEDKPGEVELVLPENAALMILGDIMNPLTLGMGNLKAMNLVEIEIEHPKSGLQTYQGIRLNDLLNLAGVGVSATQIIVTSADGYVVQIALDEVQNCTDCLLALSEDDGIILVMPGMESNFWAKDVNFLEIK